MTARLAKGGRASGWLAARLPDNAATLSWIFHNHCSFINLSAYVPGGALSTSEWLCWLNIQTRCHEADKTGNSLNSHFNTISTKEEDTKLDPSKTRSISVTGKIRSGCPVFTEAEQRFRRKTRVSFIRGRDRQRLDC